MKKLILYLSIALALAFTGQAYANGSGAGIAGSPHDFTTGIADILVTDVNLVEPGGVGYIDTFGPGPDAWNLRGEICRVCHVPHDHARATKYFTNGLLWNHAVSAATYTVYDSASMSTTPGQPDGTAKLCLGCHDGTVGIDTFDQYTTSDVKIDDYDSGFKVGEFLDGTNLDLSGTHPISMPYDETAGSGLHPITDSMGTSGTIEDVLGNANKVQCSTCHDVHDQDSASGTHLLRVANTVASGGTASGLCLTCHDK